MTRPAKLGKLQAMNRASFTRLCAPIAILIWLSACTSTPDAGDVAADTIGLARERPGVFVLADDAETTATPYGGDGAPVTCALAARDIVRLTLLLGPDLEAPDPDTGQTTDDDDGALERTREFASDLSDDLPDMATGAAVDAVVGLNPARPIIRFVGQAGEIEAAARREHELALKRRAWLRGAFDARGCDHAVLVDALARESLDQPRAD